MSDVKAAAARTRLRRLNAGENANVVYPDLSVGYGPLNDESFLADENMREHPADEDEAIDEAWLRDVGFTEDQWGFVNLEREEVRCVLVNDTLTFECDVKELNNCTRGQLRQLCRSLNIPLTEARTP